MAATCGVRPASLRRWLQRREADEAPAALRRGRPESVPVEARWRIRERYQQSYCEWGPSVLAAWANREGLGNWSPSTISRVIDDLRPPPDAPKKPLRYEIAAPGVLWSEDGAAFRERGRKRELVVVQDDHARFKVAHELVEGPASAEDVHRVLLRAFEKHGAPLVLKRDGGSIFHEESVNELLDAWGVVVITSPPHYPQYNGKKERSFRDVRSHERAQRRAGLRGPLAERIDRAIHDLNEDRPRPVLGGHTAREVFQRRQALPDRNQFRKEVLELEQELIEEAADRHQVDAARRKAVETVLSRYALLEWNGDVSHIFPAQIAT